MKWQRLIACGVIVAACSGGLPAQPIDGLVLKASLDKAVYESGEAIALSLEAHNEGSQRIDVVHNEGGYLLFLDGRPYRFDFERNQPLSDTVTRSSRPGLDRQMVRMDSSRLEPGQSALTLTLPLSETHWRTARTARTSEALVLRPGDHVVYLATATTPLPMGMPMRPPQGLGPGMSRTMPPMVMRRDPGASREMPATPRSQRPETQRTLPNMPSSASEPVFFKITGDAQVMQSLYYGRAVFDDGSPAVLPALSLKPSIFLDAPEGGKATYMAQVADDGRFVVGLTLQEVAQIKQSKLGLRAIYGHVGRGSLPYKEGSPIAVGSLGKQMSEPGKVKVARPPVYYGRILYEDGTVPSPSTGRNWMFGVSVGVPMSMPGPGKSGLDEEGYFSMFVSEREMERLKSRNRGYPIFNGPPTLQANGGRTRAPMAEFPLELLSLDKAEAGVVKIPMLDSKGAGIAPTRRERGNQGMEAATARAHARMTKMLDKQSGETDAAYQVRLRLTIRGLIKVHYPSSHIPPKRSNESEAAYQARTRVALQLNELAHNSLIAGLGEEEATYFARMTSRMERVLSIERRPGESEADYKARLKAEMARTRSLRKRVADSPAPSYAYARQEALRVFKDLYQYRGTEDALRQELLKLPRSELISLQELAKSGDTGAPAEYRKQIEDLIDTILAGSVK
jgi:hypothetical protein